MQPGTLVVGKYRVERIIGRGGMGLVVEATNVGLGSRVALKFLAEEMASDQTALARFRREAQAAAQLRSEHVCRVFDVGVEGKTPFIVMELLTGTDLARLSKVRTLDVPTAALYIKQACLGLAEAHAAKIVHRDLKPGNLFITRRADGSALIKILDFGVAKAPEDGEVRLTGTSNVVGSPGFMSPEQFRSSKSVDGRTDVWSLGVILYKLVSGRLPFKADGFAEFALAITRDAVPPLPEAPPAFEAVIARCLEKDPARRYPDVLGLAEALAPFAAQGRTSVPELPMEQEVSDEVSSGIGSTEDSGAHTLLLGAQQPHRAPAPPAAARAPAAAAAHPPAGAARPASPAAAPAPTAAKQTMLGVSQVAVKPVPAVTTLQPPAPAPAVDVPAPAPPVSLPLPAPPPSIAPQHRPTAAETALALPTAPGTGVGQSGMRYVPVGELSPGTIVGEYKIDQKIGEGGMGIVYSATHPMIGKHAAIKVISAELGQDPMLVQRFVQEARSVNQIGHPNIVDVFAFGKLPDGRNYFVMEYLQGESLRGRLTRSFMSIADAVQILDEIAGALEAAHEKGIVHRDLKPDNVYLASVRGGYIIVKLLDFGIAKLVTGGGMAKTSTGEMMGTPGYLSPEQARGKNVDYRTDIYALGCMMFEMITGRMPFMADSPMDIVMMHITTPPAKPSTYKPDIPALLEQLILEMLDKEPDKRPSLAHVRNVFAELVAIGLVRLEPGSTSTFRSDLMRRRNETESRTPRSGERNRSPSQGGPGPDAATTPERMPHPPVVAPPHAQTLGRRRNTSPSDAPTAIAFNPGLATITPHPSQPTAVLPAPLPPAPKSRRLWLTVVLLAALVPAVTITLAMVRPKEHAAADASVAPVTPVAPVATTPAVDAGVVDAAQVAAAPDAAVTTTPVTETHATGPSGEVPKQRVDRKPKHGTTSAPLPGKGSGSAGSAANQKDATIDPFQ